MKIAFMPFSYLPRTRNETGIFAPPTFALRVVLICYAIQKATRMPSLEKTG